MAGLRDESELYRKLDDMYKTRNLKTLRKCFLMSA